MAREIISGIYCIKNTLNNKYYVGRSNNIYKRWRQHKKQLADGDHVNKHLQSAVDKYGIDNFEFSILEIVEEDCLNEREQHWIKTLSAFGENGYNSTAGGEGTQGYKWTDTVKNVHCKRVVNVNSGIVYESLNYAQEITGIHSTSISSCAMNKRRFAGVINGVPQVWMFEQEYMSSTVEELTDKLHVAYHQLRNGRSESQSNSRSIICLNSGIRYNSISEAAKELNSSHSTLSRALADSNKPYGVIVADGRKLVLMYVEDADTISDAEKDIIIEDASNNNIERRKISNAKYFRRVICVNDMKCFNSIRDASEFYGIKSASISGACNHIHGIRCAGIDPVTGDKLVWLFEDECIGWSGENFKEYLYNCLHEREKRLPSNQRPVVCITTNEEFANIKAAAKKYNLSPSSIRYNCIGKCQRGGVHPDTGEHLIWRYKDITA